MAVSENEYAASDLLGNTSVPRNTLAMIRSSKRRLDPDGISNVPYYSGVASKLLKVTYTKEVVGVVTDQVVNITLSTNSLAQIITDISAVDPTNLEAFDQDGFLVIRNKNVGKTHRLEINPYATPASDAAPLLGFVTTPLPGSVSYVNELSSSIGSRSQQNPQGTALLGHGEDLSTSSINRGLTGVLELVAKNGIDLDAPVIVFKEKQLSFVLQAATGLYYAAIADDTIRVPIYDPAIGSFLPHPRYFKIYEDPGNHYPARSINMANSVIGSTGFTAHQYTEDFVSDVVYGTSGINIDASIPFVTWGVPDGHNIYDASIPNKDKHASTAITSIFGDVVYCASATFQTKKVQPGDPVFLTASTLTPFDHTGWFIVKKVYDETHISVRPVSPAELTPTVANKPRSLNPAAGGTLRVAMGYYIPAGSLLMVVNTDRALTNVLVKIACAVPLREALAAEVADTNEGTLTSILTALNSHLFSGTADGHPPEAIKGVTLPAWADATQITDASTDLKSTLTDLVSFLASTSSTGSQGGTKKIGGQAISIGGAAPNSLSAGTLYSQLTALLTDIQAAATAAGTSYAGGGNWADGTTNPATTVEAQLDKIISDLATGSGAAKIQYAGGGAWADGTTNPAATAGAQLTKIVSDLAGTGGTAKVGGAASTDLSADTLANQILALAAGWLKMNRVNTISAAQTFSALLTANLGVLVGANQNVVISGTGLYKRGMYTRYVPALMGAPGSGVTPNGTGYAYSGNGQDVFISVPLDTYERIVNARGVVTCGATDVIAMQAFEEDWDNGFGGSTYAGPVSSTLHTFFTEHLVMNGLNWQPNPAGYGNLYFRFRTTAWGSGPTVLGIELDIDIP